MTKRQKGILLIGFILAVGLLTAVSLGTEAYELPITTDEVETVILTNYIYSIELTERDHIGKVVDALDNARQRPLGKKHTGMPPGTYSMDFEFYLKDGSTWVFAYGVSSGSTGYIQQDGKMFKVSNLEGRRLWEALSAEVPAVTGGPLEPGEKPSMICVNNAHYTRGVKISSSELTEDALLLGEVRSTVSRTQVPRENFQANFPVDGAALYQLGQDLIVRYPRGNCETFCFYQALD